MLYLEKNAPFCQILKEEAPDYRALLSSGLFTAYTLGVSFPYFVSHHPLRPIILLALFFILFFTLKNRDRKVSCKTYLNDGISFMKLQNTE